MKVLRWFRRFDPLGTLSALTTGKNSGSPPRLSWLKASALGPRVILSGFMVLQLLLFTPLDFRFLLLGCESVVSLTPKDEPVNGTIKGTVRIESKIPSKSFPLNFYSRKGTTVNRNHPAVPVNEIENVVIYLEETVQAKDKTLLMPQTSAEPQPAIRQINEFFSPHVLPIVVGTVVQFPNEDPFFHNVFSLSGTKSFDLGRYPKGHTRSVKFDRPGIVKVFCHIHSHMNAVILVFDHPYFCVPLVNGNFVIDHIPPGRYTLVVWHERLKPFKQVVSIQPGTQLSLELVL